MTEHEKRIQEALAECVAEGYPSALISTADLRALLAYLDAVRGALDRLSKQCDRLRLPGQQMTDAERNAKAQIEGAKHG